MWHDKKMIQPLSAKSKIVMPVEGAPVRHLGCRRMMVDHVLHLIWVLPLQSVLPHCIPTTTGYG